MPLHWSTMKCQIKKNPLILPVQTPFNSSTEIEMGWQMVYAKSFKQEQPMHKGHTQ